MDSKEPLSGYAELAGGVSAFGGLGRNFCRLGASFGVLGGVPAASFGDKPAPTGMYWDFIINGNTGERVTNERTGLPVVTLVWSA